jgi:hypothetical protein
VQGCFPACGFAGLSCGGAQCLTSSVKGLDNVCSDGVHPESCDVRWQVGGGEWCSCDGAAKPGTCPQSVQVCKADGFLPNSFHCVSCGDPGSDGLVCKDGKTCDEAGKKCK